MSSVFLQGAVEYKDVDPGKQTHGVFCWAGLEEVTWFPAVEGESICLAPYLFGWWQVMGPLSIVWVVGGLSPG